MFHQYALRIIAAVVGRINIDVVRRDAEIMGSEYRAECKECGRKFELSEGGGFMFHLLRCNACGASKSMSFEEIGEPHIRYIKGLRTPYCMATAENDRQIQEKYPGKPLPERSYHAAVEKMAGKCRCGGTFKFNAKPRCPKCKSTRLIKGEVMIDYD
jgi:hypothetical protein